ncbi:MAG TPA: 3D-(3,5/4)-trihydroxycyclohexane-1,2-dione acylhydrolase (decyclizing) [Candidatus Xenobia bacterium]|jgi:3D-(3,5/4)-trihydroxycyclohexane-1,2-dione acylhydrolase (decyclizing)
MSKTRRLTMAQALVAFLKVQRVERDGHEHPFFGGCFGIFGHGNLAGVGEALQENPDFTYYQCRNEQAMVHTAAAYAKASRRLRALACTTSIGPGATNMLTGAAGATINRLPVLLLPGDIFGRRQVAPVLQQLEHAGGPDISVNDCFRPVSRYFDRIWRPDQLLTSLPEAMRVLTSPAETGAVTLALPQDVQTEAFDCPPGFLEPRVWHVARPRPDRDVLKQAATWINQAKCPVILAGGGVLYSAAEARLAAFCQQTGMAVAETQAGKSSVPADAPFALGAVGATGTSAANRLCGAADLIIGIGTRYSDFTTASKTLFDGHARFININVTDFDGAKHGGLSVVGDAAAVLEELATLVTWQASPPYRRIVRDLREAWEQERDKLTRRGDERMSQAQILGEVNRTAHADSVVVCAAGSLPGDLHKLWQARAPLSYHLEYGYSCMGYEIAGALGVKMALPEREVICMVGDGSYLMMAQEIVTAVQEGLSLTIVLIDNYGYGSIGGLSESVGSGGFGTRYRYRKADTRQLDGRTLPVDLCANAASLGANSVRVQNATELHDALVKARSTRGPSVIVVEADPSRLPGYHSWWDVPVAEVSGVPAVQGAREQYEAARQKQHWYGIESVPDKAVLR